MYEVFLQDVSDAVDLKAPYLRLMRLRGEGIIVVDAVEERDLTLIAQRAGCRRCRARRRSWSGECVATVELFMQDRQRLPVLVVAGSMSEATRRQVDNALCRGRAEVVDIDAARAWCRMARNEIASVVRAGRAVKSASTYDFTHQPSRRRSTVNRRAVRKIRDEYRQQLGERLSQRQRRHVKHYRAGADWRAVSDRRRYRATAVASSGAERLSHSEARWRPVFPVGVCKQRKLICRSFKAGDSVRTWCYVV